MLDFSSIALLLYLVDRVMNSRGGRGGTYFKDPSAPHSEETDLLSKLQNWARSLKFLKTQRRVQQSFLKTILSWNIPFSDLDDQKFEIKFIFAIFAIHRTGKNVCEEKKNKFFD